MPDHDREPREQLHPRLRPDHRLPRRLRLRHPRRRRHRLPGAVVTRYYDPMLEKVTAWAPSPEEAIARMDRPRVPHPRRRHQPRLPRGAAGAAALPRRRLHDALHRRDARAVPARQEARPGDQAPDLRRRRHGQRPPGGRGPRPPRATGTKPLLDRLGPAGFAAWMREQARVLVTDTTMRDAPQSLLATRMRTTTSSPAPTPTRGLPQLLSLDAGAAPPSTSPCAS